MSPQQHNKPLHYSVQIRVQAKVTHDGIKEGQTYKVVGIVPQHFTIVDEWGFRITKPQALFFIGLN